MKFKIVSTDYYDENEKIIKKYPCLKDFGFEIEKYEAPVIDFDYKSREFKTIGTVTKYRTYLTINSLERLIELETAVEYPLIITEDEIEIYDSYRE